MARKNGIKIYSTHNKGKSVVAGIFIRTVKNKIYKYITSVSKSLYINKLDDIVTKYNNTYHSTMKMKPVDVKSSTYIGFDKKSNKEDPKSKFGDNVRVSKYKNVVEKSYVPNWSGEDFVIIKAKNTVPQTYAISDLNGEKIVGTFYKRESQKTNQKLLRIGKAIKRKVDKLYAKWKGYNNSSNSWIDKKDIVT